MKRWLVCLCGAGLLTWGIAGQARGQGSGSSGSSQPGVQPVSPGSGGSRPSGSARTPIGQLQEPLYVDGRVLSETGQPFPEAVPVKLVCGVQTLQAIRTDIRGYFQITLGAGPQSNMDASAADNVSMASVMSSPASISDMTAPGGMGGLHSLSSNSLTGCELQVMVAGYQPLTHTITGPAQLGRIDVGTLRLQRLGEAGSPSISVAALLVPDRARREFERGVQEARNRRLDQAERHLKNAVDQYNKYGAAWYELGRVYSAGGDVAKARESFQKAVEAEPNFPAPYVNLAAMDLQERKFESALETVGKALALDAALRQGLAGFIQSVAYINLGRVEEAEQSALAAQQGPHQNIPQLHVLLADIFQDKQDYDNAAAQMRAYLKEAPQGPLADQMKARLQEIEASGAATSPRVAP